MSYRPGTKRSGKSFASGGTVYAQGGANFEIRRHQISREIIVEPQKTKIIPLLNYFPTEPNGTATSGGTKISAMGSKVYENCSVQEGSYVQSISLDMTIQPETLNSATILDFYVGRIAVSFHDTAGGQVYGLEADASTGKTKFSDETGGSPTLTDVANSSTGMTNAPPETPLTKALYDNGDVVKHWIRGVRKNVIYGGQPALYTRKEYVPSKCKRSNTGMFYGLVFMNDAVATSGDTTDNLRIDIKEHFIERPLLQ